MLQIYIKNEESANLSEDSRKIGDLSPRSRFSSLA